jgi:putative PIN family toxin of toxin-antitoxin system
MRVVVDTNVLISGVIKPKSRIASFYTYLKQRDFLLLYSSDSFGELARVLFRLLRRGKYDLSQEGIESVLDLIVTLGQKVKIVSTINASRDLADNNFLELAVDGRADYLVSGDKDLLILNPFQNIPIITPAEFLELLEKQ